MTGSGAAVSPIAAGMRCACPRCGKGKLFNGFLTVAERCGTCGLDLAKQDSGDGPAVFLIFILGFIAVPPILLFSLNVDWPLWLHTVVWSVLILGLALGMLRPAKAAVIAIQYRHRRDIEG